jgi:apolipoprotein N-acyltransferase
MAQAGSLLSLFLGASLFGVASRVAFPPAAWIGLAALIHASRSMRAVPGVLLLWLALYASLVIARGDTFPVPGPIYLFIFAVEAMIVTLPFIVDRIASPRISGVPATLVFPMALVAAEFLRSRFTPEASWGSIAYSQYGFMPLMQVSAVTGIWGITFVVAWFASTFEFAWNRSFTWTEIRGPVLTYGVALVAILVAGCVRLMAAPTDRASIRIATLNRPVDLFAPGEMTKISEGRVSTVERERFNAKLSRLHDWFLDGTRREARAGARLIVWPEQNLLVFDEDEPAFLDRAKRLAADERVYLAMGMGTIHLGDQLPFENKVVLIDPSGNIVASHLKNRPVSGWEASIMRRGYDGIPVVATDTGRMAAAICFEADFPELIRQAGRNDADVLIVPVNEWRAIKNIHFQMHVFRAIENGVPLVRAAASGMSAAIDPWGRVLSTSDFFAPGDRTMTAQLPSGRIPTLYARAGDWFSWLCVAGLAAILAVTTISTVERSTVQLVTRELFVFGRPK